MNSARFDEITARYERLRVAVVGDLCLDRYLEIDPSKAEISIETGLEVHNVVDVRNQPGGAGTIINNLVALGIGEIVPVCFLGEEGEGYELMRSLKKLHGVKTDHVCQTPLRRTFTYCKPLVRTPGQPPRELNRLDSKNWSPTPATVEEQLIRSLRQIGSQVDAVILLDQVDVAETGVVTRGLLSVVREMAGGESALRPFILADSRRGLKGYPAVCLKMNAAELRALTGRATASVNEVKGTAAELAQHHGQPVFITLAEAGIVGAEPDGTVAHRAGFPVRGEIDVVGAGDAVTANLSAALAAGAHLREALDLAMAAASVVIHQLGTTGAAHVSDLRERLFSN